MPLVAEISRIAQKIIGVPCIYRFLLSTGLLALVNGVLSTIGLTFMMAFLPTFLGIIFRTFYELKAGRWVQLHMQAYYFWFLVLFVLLVTAVGTNLPQFLIMLTKYPFSPFL